VVARRDPITSSFEYTDLPLIEAERDCLGMIMISADDHVISLRGRMVHETNALQRRRDAWRRFIEVQEQAGVAYCQ
jgi:hypothetical protein